LFLLLFFLSPPRFAPSRKAYPENVPPSNVLGCFGLSSSTNEQDLKDRFSEFGPIEAVTVIYDKQEGRSRGFGFVTFASEKDASIARDEMNGVEFQGRRIRVDYSTTSKGHEATPGQYMGRRNDGDRDRERRHSGGRDYDDRGGRDRDRGERDFPRRDDRY